jgi:S-DNA-T family DNA segregation ATPase FtsK/SpoIIIE
MAARSEAKRIEGGMQAATMAKLLREVALILCGALALILLAALLSYDRGDPAFSSTGQPGPVHNIIGPLGAWLSDLFFVLFGAPAFLFPVLLGLAGWALYLERKSKEPIDRRIPRCAAPGLRRRSSRAAVSRRCTSAARITRTPRAACSAR